MAISIEDSSSTFIQPPSVYDTPATPAPSQDHARSLTTTTSHIPAGSLRNEPRTAASSDQPPTKFDPSTNNQNAIQEADGFASSSLGKAHLFFSHWDPVNPEQSTLEDFDTSVRRFLTFKILQKAMSNHPERLRTVIMGDCRTVWKLMVDIFSNVSYAQGQLAHQALIGEHMHPEESYTDFQPRFETKLNHLLSTGFEFDEASIIQSHVAAISTHPGFTRDIDTNKLSLYTSYADLVQDLNQHAQSYSNNKDLREMYKQERGGRHSEQFPPYDSRDQGQAGEHYHRRKEQGHTAKENGGRGTAPRTPSNPAPKIGFVKEQLNSMGKARIGAKDRLPDKLDKPPMAPAGDCSTDYNYGGCPFGLKCKYKHVVGKPNNTSVPLAYKCHRCGKQGHWWIFCPSDLKNIEVADQATCSMARRFGHEQEDGPDGGTRMAIVDSAADRHLFGFPGQFDSISSLSRPVCIDLPSSGSIMSYQSGTVTMHMTDTDDCHHRIKLEEALLVPELASSDVVSVNQLIPSVVNSIALHNDEMRLDLNVGDDPKPATILIAAHDHTYSLISPVDQDSQYEIAKRSHDQSEVPQPDPPPNHSAGSQPDSATHNPHLNTTFGKGFSSDNEGDGPGAEEEQPADDPVPRFTPLPTPHPPMMTRGRLPYATSIPSTPDVTLPTVYVPHRTVIGQVLDHCSLPSCLDAILTVADQSQLTKLDVQHLFLSEGCTTHQGESLRPSTLAIFNKMITLDISSRNWENICNILDGLATTYSNYDAQNLAGYYRSLATICHKKGVDRDDLQAFTEMSMAHDLHTMRSLRAELTPRLSLLVSATDFRGFDRREYKILCNTLINLYEGTIKIGNDAGACFDPGTASKDLCKHIVAARTIPCWEQDPRNGTEPHDPWGVTSFIGASTGLMMPGEPTVDFVPGISVKCATTLTEHRNAIEQLTGMDQTPYSVEILPNAASAASIRSQMPFAPTTDPIPIAPESDDDDSEYVSDGDDPDFCAASHVTGIANSTTWSPTAWRLCQCNTCDDCASRLFNHHFSGLSCLNSLCRDRTCAKCTSAIMSANAAADAWVVPMVLRGNGAARSNPEFLSQRTRLTDLCPTHFINPANETVVTTAYGYSIRHLQGGDEKKPVKRSHRIQHPIDRNDHNAPRIEIDEQSINHGVAMLKHPEQYTDLENVPTIAAAKDALNKSFPLLAPAWPNHNLFRSTQEDRYWNGRRSRARKFLLTLEQANLLNDQCNPITRLPLREWRQYSYQADLSAAIVRRLQSWTPYNITDYQRI